MYLISDIDNVVGKMYDDALIDALKAPTRTQGSFIGSVDSIYADSRKKGKIHF